MSSPNRWNDQYELGYGVHGLICNQMNKSERDHGGGGCNLYLSSKQKICSKIFQNFDRSGNSRIDVLAGEILFYGRLNQKKRKKKDNNRQVECLLLSSL